MSSPVTVNRLNICMFTFIEFVDKTRPLHDTLHNKQFVYQGKNRLGHLYTKGAQSVITNNHHWKHINSNGDAHEGTGHEELHDHIHDLD
jgi:hypothetical protein